MPMDKNQPNLNNSRLNAHTRGSGPRNAPDRCGQPSVLPYRRKAPAPGALDERGTPRRFIVPYAQRGVPHTILADCPARETANWLARPGPSPGTRQRSSDSPRPCAGVRVIGPRRVPVRPSSPAHTALGLQRSSSGGRRPPRRDTLRGRRYASRLGA